MRRAQTDKGSQLIRNLAYNPSFEAAGITAAIRTNAVINPSTENPGSVYPARTNHITNPSAEVASGTVNVRTNLALNPSFDATSGVTNVRTNLLLNPSMETTTSTNTVRTNLVTNPALGTNSTGWTVWGGGQSHPDIVVSRAAATWASSGWSWKVQGSATSVPAQAEIGIGDYNLPVGTPITVSLYLMASGTRKARFRVRGIGGGGDFFSPDFTLNATTPTRVYFSTTVPAGSTAGVSVNIKDASTADAFGASDWIAGSMALIETTNTLLPYFDGSEPAYENIVKVAPSFYNGLVGTTGISYAGSTWSRGTVPINGTGGMVRQFVDLADMRQGERYTTSVTVANDQSTAQGINFDMGDTTNTTFTIQPGEIRRITITGTRTLQDSIYRFSDLDVHSSATEARSILFKDWVIEVGPTTGEYYTGTGDFTYAWNGTAHASTSAQRAPSATYWSPASTAVVAQSATQKYSGGKSAAIHTKGGNGDGTYASDISAIVAGASYTFSAWIKQTTAHALTFDFRWKDSGGGILADSLVSVAPVVGQWTRVSATAVAPTGGSVALLQPMIRIYEAHTGTVLYIDDALLERASGLNPYFDGSTPAAGDFTYVWSGTTNSSFSHQQAPVIATWQNRWYGNSGGNGALYQAKGGLSGTYARKLWTSANTGATMDAGINLPPMAVSPNTPYTLSAWVRSSVAQNMNFYMQWNDSGGASVGVTQQTTGTPISANTWTRLSITFTSHASAASAYFIIGPFAQGLAMPTGATLDFDNVMIEAAPGVRDYFDGSNPIQNLVTNPSVEVNTSGWAVKGSGTPATLSRDTTRSYLGAASLKLTVGDDAFAQGVGFVVSGLTIGKTYTMSGYVFVPTGTSDVLSTIAGIGYGTSVTTRNSWTRTTMTFVATATTHNVGFDTGITNLGKSFWVDAVMLNDGNTALTYLEGAGDFTFTWAGAANASASLMQAPAVTGVNMAPSLCYAYQSKTVGISSGTKSIRITPMHPSTGDSFAELPTSITFKPYTTYTISGTRTILAPQTNVNGSTGFRINIGSELTPTFVVPVASNVAGSQRVVARFTTGASVTYGFIRVYNGSYFGGGDVWWDDIMLEEGITNGSYFDGSNPLQNLFANSSFETNTTGWLPDTGAPTLTSDSAQAWVGSKSLKAVSTVASADVAVWAPATLQPHSTYTLSWYVYSLAARTAHFDVAGNPAYNLSAQGLKTVPANTWTRVSATFTTPSVVNGPISFYLHHAGGPNSSGNTIYIDGILLERAPTLGPYYDGLGDFTYEWSGTANASTSLQQGTMVYDRQAVQSTNSIFQSSVRANTGTKSGAVRTKVDVLMDGTIMYSATEYTVGATSIAANVPNTWSLYVWVPSGSGTVRLVDVATGSVGPPNTLFDQWERISVTFTGLNTGQQHILRLRAYTTIPAGTTIWWDNELIEAANTVRPYFDGSTVSPDFTYQWNGTANNSTSTQRVNYIADVGNSGTAFCIQSSDWSSSGSKSVRVITASAGEPEAGLNTSRMEPGKTYTVTAKLRINKVAAGSTSRARRINFYHSNNNQQSFFTQVGTTSPNAVGTYQHRLVITIPSDTTHIYLRLGGHSAAAFDADAYWDDLMIVEGDYTGDYVDGTKPLAKWDGTAHSAVSVGYPPQFLDIAGKPSLEQAGIGTSANVVVNGFIARTIYIVYETGNTNDTSWQTPFYYGVSAPSTGFTLQTAAAGNFTVSPRLDFTSGGGSINRGFNFPNGRTPSRRHVLAVSFNPGMTYFNAHGNGVSLTTNAVIDPGTDGWTSGQLRNVDRPDVDPVYSCVYYAEHDADTRVAISRYLGNKYGAFVA